MRIAPCTRPIQPGSTARATRYTVRYFARRMHAHDPHALAARRLLLAGSATAAGASPTTDKVARERPAAAGLQDRGLHRPGARRALDGARSARHAVRRHARRGARSTRSAARPATRRKPTRARRSPTKLNMPNGVAFRDGALYVAEINRILRYDDIEASLDTARRSRRSCATTCRRIGITAGATSRSVPTASCTCPIGAPCNVCNEPKYAVDHAHESRTARATKCSRAACATPSASPGIRRRKRALVHRQRARLARRRRAAVRAERRAARRPRLRLSVLPRQGHQGSGVRQARRVQQDRRRRCSRSARTSRRSA